MWKDVTWLAAPERKGRGSGTDDEGVARDWLVTQLKDAALEPEVQPFSFRRFKSANVIATITPPAPHKAQPILIGAHYDHVGVRKGKLYPGAEDNASGTAMVLAVARALVARRSELSRPVIVVFFGAEEAGLHGSDAFAAKWDFKQRPLHAMINIDMIGRPLVDQPGLWLAASLVGVLSDVDPDQAVGVVLPEPPGEIADLAKEACKEAGVRAITIADLPPKLRPMLEEMSRGRSDHAAFEKRGVPFAFFSSGESSDYHQPTDTADKVDPKILEQRADAVLRLVLKLAR